VIVSGDPTTIIDGQLVARHGDKTACGATLISGSQVQVFLDSGGGGGSRNSGSQAKTASASGPVREAAPVPGGNKSAEEDAVEYDEQLQFVNVNGAKLADVDYRVELEDGEVLRGTTDAEGKTGRMTTAQPTRLVRAELLASRTSCCSLHASQTTSAPLVVQVSAATNANQLGSSVQQVATPAGKARGLTSGEIAMARLLFADSVDYGRVKVHNGEYLWLGMQPDDTAMTPNGEMYFNEKHFLEDFSTARGVSRSWFMHEMVHVWQHHLGCWVKARGAIRMGLSYQYELASGNRLNDYNMEAQGNLLADYYMLKFERKPGLVTERRYAVFSALPLFESVLSNFLNDPRNGANLP